MHSWSKFFPGVTGKLRDEEMLVLWGACRLYRGLLLGIARGDGRSRKMPGRFLRVASAAISKILVDKDLFLDYCPWEFSPQKLNRTQRDMFAIRSA